MIPSNDIELMIDINNKMSIVINRVSKKLTAELHEIIQTNVYDAYDPVAYERTNEFLKSWDEGLTTVVGNLVENIIKQNYSAMSTDSLNNYVKDFAYSEANKLISNHSEKQNGVENIAQAIEGGNKFYHHPVEDANDFKRPFWDEFIKYCTTNFYKFFQEEMERMGL